ncbi:Outer membrane component of tripartite multidrug resistance system [Methylacidimicrobium sp. AP8]|uniref:efflux transporter outer membrane subunit n=1 Tax=Methylacidimicrobium sp. AP8 TaxID=2730359 RepID=UPI0018C19CB9|nr:efflux transporter outer membrane subunit [Methylacidimicrobium sp. AP8]CAB4243217.1 Outer membrane component of tripartite multidrug resistance system [Methylacidimicrobium sp. AP8]
MIRFLFSFRAAPLLSGAMALTGCAFLPKGTPVAQKMPLPPMEKTLAAAGPVRPSPEWTRPLWWKDLHSSELDRILDEALSGNPGLRAAADRIRSSWAIAAHERGRLLPGLEGRPWLLNDTLGIWQIPGSSFFGPFGGRSFAFADYSPAFFTYHVDLWGEDRARIRAAVGEARAAMAEFAVAQLSLSTTIARRYIELLSRVEEKEIVQKMVAQLREDLALARSRHRKAGIDTLLPVYSLEQRLAAARQRERILEREETVLRDEIATLAGKGPDWGRTIRIAPASFPRRFPLPSTVPLELLSRRPDVAVALWRVELAAQRVKVAKTAFYPNVNLVGFAGFQSLNMATVLLAPAQAFMYMVGPAITLPLFERGQLTARLVAEQEEYNIAVERYNAAVLDAARSVADALAQWKESVENLTTQDTALSAAHRFTRLTDSRYQAGLVTRMDLIEASLAAQEQELRLSSLTASHLESVVALHEVLGGGYQTQTTQ